jgi:hypothetical protein
VSDDDGHDGYFIDIDAAALGKGIQILHDGAVGVMKADGVDKKKDAVVGIGQIDLLSLFLLNFVKEDSRGLANLFDKYFVVILRSRGAGITFKEAGLSRLQFTDA